MLKKGKYILSSVEKSIFIGSFLLLLIVVVPIFIFPDKYNEMLIRLNDTINTNFSVVYSWTTILVLLFTVWIVFSKIGFIRLGKTKPVFSVFSWASMLFCAGVATGILYWGKYRMIILISI